MLFEFLVKIISIILTITVTTIHYIFKLCVSSENKKARFYFNYVIFYFSLFLIAVLYTPVLIVFKPDGDPGIFSLLSPYHKYLTEKIIGLKIILRNGEELSKDRAAVVLQNHQSSLEILINLHNWSLVKKIIPVSKKELQYLFPLSILFYYACGHLIPRNNRTEASKEIEAIRETVLNRKARVWYYPEGTRNRLQKDTMLPFKKGGFELAVDAQIPIIPVVASPYYFLDYEKKIFDKGRIILQALEPVPTKGLTRDDIPKLVNTVRQRMLDEYKKLSEEVGYTNERRRKSFGL